MCEGLIGLGRTMTLTPRGTEPWDASEQSYGIACYGVGW